MSLPVALQPSAQLDLVKAAEWYEARRTGLGERFHGSIGQALQAIEAYPESFANVRKDVRRALVKEFPYAIYFRIEQDAIAVLTILHTSRSAAVVRRRT